MHHANIYEYVTNRKNNASELNDARRVHQKYQTARQTQKSNNIVTLPLPSVATNVLSCLLKASQS